MLQVFHCLHEPFKTSSFWQDFLRESNICRKLASCLFFAGILQDDSYLQEQCKISIICKNLARFLQFAQMSQDISFLQDSRYFLKPLQNTYMQKLRKYRMLSKILTYIFWLQESCQKSIVCKNLWGHLFFASISQRI